MNRMIRDRLLFRDFYHILFSPSFLNSQFYKKLQGLNQLWFRQVIHKRVWHKPTQTNTKPHMDFGGVIFSLIFNTFQPIYTLHQCELISLVEGITTEKR